MDRQFDIDNFERLLKERSEEFRMYPTKRVWHSIYNNIHPGKKWPSIATCIVLISILLLIGFLNTNESISAASNTTNKNFTTTTALAVQNNNGKFFTPFFSLKTSGDNKLTEDVLLSDFILQGQHKQITELTNFKNTQPSNFENTLTNPLSNINLSYRKDKSDNLNYTLNSSPKNIAGIYQKNNEHANLDDITTVYAKENSIVNPLNTANVNGNRTNNNFNLFLENQLKNIESENEKDFNTNLEIKIPAGNLKIFNKNSIHLSETVAGTGNHTEINNNKIINKVKAATTKVINNDVVYTALVLNETDKAWIENYAQYNRPVPKRWAGKLGWQLYITPSVVYRTLKNYVANETDINKEVIQHPSIGLEIGAGIIYPIFKGIKIKTGLQLNSTRYNTEAYENSHPVSTTITLNDAFGQNYQTSRTTPFSNIGGITPTNLHNETYQISIPVGAEFKIAGNDILQWNIGATIEPSYVFGGNSYLISSDKRNFIKETTYINRLNLNAGFETFLSYKMDGFTFQIGPQFRKQIFTTNSKAYTIQEKLTNYGIRFGITKLIK